MTKVGATDAESARGTPNERVLVMNQYNGKRRGRPSLFKPEYVEQARKLCLLGHTDFEIAQFFDVTDRCFYKWKAQYPELVQALNIGKEEADKRVTRSLYARAVGYNYEAVKIFMPAGREKPVYAPYVEHVPPDVTAGIFWLKNRDPRHWRDSQQMEHVLGKYIISDQPMSEGQWARERADVIDGTVIEKKLPPSQQVIDDAASLALPLNSTPRGK
jgi:hypothetical protein